MPLMVHLRANPSFKPDGEEQKAAYAAAKARGTFETDYVNAMENIANSKGMYALAEAASGVPTMAPRALEDMDLEELKVMMLQTGITPQKQMTKTEVIKSIRIKLAAVEIVDEG